MKVVRTVSEADLVRLKHERHEADRRYNQALTALDAAIQALHNNQAKLTSGALSTAAAITELVTAAVLVLFTPAFWRK